MQAVHVGDGEDEKEALALLHVEFSHGGELLCPCRIKAEHVSIDDMEVTMSSLHFEDDLLSLISSILCSAVILAQLTSISICFLYESSMVGS